MRTKSVTFSSAKYQFQRAIRECVIEGSCTQDDCVSAREFFGGCAYCGKPEAPRNDHLVPVAKNGDFVRTNVVPSCGKCDDSKGQRDFHTWMREARGPSSLRSRKYSDAWIEERIRLIEQWQQDYTPRTDEEVFGVHLNTYHEILRGMDDLVGKAQQLVEAVNSQRRTFSGQDNPEPRRETSRHKGADDIRQYVLDKYILPARARGDTVITIRSGDVHSEMGLRAWYANVCQALGRGKLIKMAKIALIRTQGRPGANMYFTYQL